MEIPTFLPMPVRRCRRLICVTRRETSCNMYGRITMYLPELTSVFRPLNRVFHQVARGSCRTFNPKVGGSSPPRPTTFFSSGWFSVVHAPPERFAAFGCGVYVRCAELGHRPAAGLWFLVPATKVRILVAQPRSFIRPSGRIFYSVFRFFASNRLTCFK